jgi:hypothetical protein
MSAASALKLSCHSLYATLELILIDLDRAVAVTVSVLGDEPSLPPIVGRQLRAGEAEHAVF